MKVCIPVYQGVNMLDVTGPMEMFFWSKIDTVIAAERPGEEVRAITGLRFFADAAFDDITACDVVWVPGGAGEALERIVETEPRYLDFLTRVAPSARYVASVCEGAVLLAAAGLLDGYEVTTHWAFEGCFPRYYPAVTIVPGHPRWHLDRNRLTGGGISSGLDEALKLVELLKGTAAAEETQRTTQYYPQPPVTSTIPDVPVCPLKLRTELS